MTHFPSSSQLPDGSSSTEEATIVLRQFYAQFPNEEDCLEELYRRLKENGLVRCRYCGLSDLERSYGDRVCKCSNCHRKTWFTAGTFFNRLRNSRHCLAIIWLMERGIILSSSRLHAIIGISQSHALSIRKKLATVIEPHMDDEAQPVPSSLFALVLCKRSRETPARAHPVAELEEVQNAWHDNADNNACSSAENKGGSLPEKDQTASAEESAQRLEYDPTGTAEIPAGPGTDDTSADNMLDSQQKEVYKLISETPVHFDSLCQSSGMPVGELSAALVMLELDGLVTRQDGDYYVRSISKSTGKNAHRTPFSPDPPAAMASTIAAFLNFVRTHLHGISRKYLQNYLAIYWCHIDRARWQCGSLLRACLLFRPISYDQILDYVSPPSVKILLGT